MAITLHFQPRGRVERHSCREGLNHVERFPIPRRAGCTVTRPNFFIVGAPRCGTTALYTHLQQHPDVYMPYRKEPRYFGDDLPQRPPYLDQRAYLRLFDAAVDAARVGEATVWYLYSDSAAQQIRSFASDARIIIMLRRPVEMTYSLHGLFPFTTWEDLTDFGEAVDAEADRWQARRLPPNTWWPQALQYRWLADYAPHVERYLRLFGPERVKAIVYDDFRADTRLCGTCLAFLASIRRSRCASAS